MTAIEQVRELKQAGYFEAFPRSLRGSIEEAVEVYLDGLSPEDRAAAEERAAWVLEAATAAEPAARALWARAERGEVLVPFRSEIDRKYSRSDAWVVQASGELRESDDDVIGYKTGRGGRGEVRWDLVESDELALVWCGQAFEVCHAPVGGPNDAQRATVARLEGEIAALRPGDAVRVGRGWGLRHGALPLPAPSAVVEAIRAGATALRAELFGGFAPKWSQLVSREGVELGHEAPHGLDRHICGTETWEGGIRPVEAVIVRRTELAGGVVDFLYFKKYGKMNLAARWRDLS